MAIINGKELKLITSGAIPQKQMEEHKKFLGSSKKDFIKQGYEPGSNGDGILASWQNIPLGYYDIPTANMMVYSKSLWEKIIGNDTLNQLIQTGAFWMENDHKDSAETLVSNIAGRITSWEVGDHNLIIGNVEILDTPEGRKTYILSRVGAVGTSTRGFGVLDQIGNGLTNVNEEEYVHVDSDWVTIPACVTSRVSFREDLNNSLVVKEDEQLRSLVKSAFEQNPNDFRLLQMMNVIESGKYEEELKKLSRQQRIAASLRRR